MSKIDIDKLVASVYKYEVQKLPSGGQWSTTLWTLDEVLREQGLKYKAGEIVGIEPNLSNVSENGKECKPANFVKSSKNLQESEDEKIRKWIINEIKIKHHNLDEENVDFVDKAIAWLEKQGNMTERVIWKEIPKDKDGFFDENSDLYDRLPIIITEEFKDFINLYYIDKENWHETIADLSRQRFVRYIEVRELITKLYEKV